MRLRKEPQTAELEIISLSKEGHGIGSLSRPDGKVCQVEVPFTLPGDKVRVLLVDKYKGVYKAQLEEILSPAAQRIAPVCTHFGSCGGCRWQNTAYEDQLQRKEEWIRTCFAPYLNHDVTFFPIIPCSPPWQYRNKMEFSFSSDRAGRHFSGLILYASRGKVFNLQECHLTHPWFVQALHSANQWWEESKLDAYHPNQNTGSLRTLTVREGQRTGDRLVMLTVSGNPDFGLNRQQLDRFKAILCASLETPENRLSLFLRIQQIAKGTPTQFFEIHLHGPDHIREILHIQEIDASYDLTFKISPSAFFQPNTAQAERLYSRALQMAQIPANGIVYDLYCGTGTLGICAAKHAKEVLGIELSPESVVDARENIKANGLANIQIIEGDVGKMLAEVIQTNKNRPDVVMVDPPRAGLDAKAIQYLLEIKAPTLLYISCNPVTQAGNLEELLRGGYRLEAVQPVDQFPQTVHVENIAVLRAVHIQG